MQSITAAISPAGIEYFARSILEPQLTHDLSGLKPQNQTINVGTVNESTYDWFNEIVVNLTGKSVSNFNPQFQAVAQQSGGAFQLLMTGANFQANYDWSENGNETRMTDQTSVNLPYSSDFGWSPTVSSLSVPIIVQFQYQNNAYQVVVTGTNPTANVPQQIPEQSVTHMLEGDCAADAIPAAVKTAVTTVDFSGSIQNLIPPLLDSIPASGALTPDIVFSFGLGDSGLTFPNNTGLAIGATGRVTWKNQAYPASPPPPLPVPVPPTDSHHMQLYVGNYALNGLYWAFYQDGQLTSTIQPSDLVDPDVLKVSTYTSLVPALKPYSGHAMQAQVQPIAVPTVAFQMVYVLSSGVMNTLQTQLPAPDYNSLTGLSGNAYTSQAALESDLASVQIPSTEFATIEAAAKAMGAVVTHDLQFTLTILNEPNPAPYFQFTVNRTDILEGLVLGITATWRIDNSSGTKPGAVRTFIVQTLGGQISNGQMTCSSLKVANGDTGAYLFELPASDLALIQNQKSPTQALIAGFTAAGYDLAASASITALPLAQSLQFGFTKVSAEETFDKSNIPGLNATTLGPTIWQVVGEPRYDALLGYLGGTGVALPMMNGFQFLFEEAVLSIQEGYVSILTDVQSTS